MAGVIVPTAGGDKVALGQLARIEVVRGPALVKSENAMPNYVVYAGATQSIEGAPPDRTRDVIFPGSRVRTGHFLR